MNITRQQFIDHLEFSQQVVQTWPDWKRQVFGLTKPNVNESGHDDAGVKEAVEALEWVVHDAFYRAPETVDRDTCATYVYKIQQALSVLTGETQKESDATS